MVATGPPFCFAGFGTDRLRCQQAMKTARRKPNRWAQVSSNRADEMAGQNRSCSFNWAAKQENFQPLRTSFFLTSPFIELHGTWPESRSARWSQVEAVNTGYLLDSLFSESLRQSSNRFSNRSRCIRNSRLQFRCTTLTQGLGLHWRPSEQSK